MLDYVHGVLREIMIFPYIKSIIPIKLWKLLINPKTW